MGGARGKAPGAALRRSTPVLVVGRPGLLLMPWLGESADEAPRFAVDVALKVGQGFLAVLALGLRLEEKNGQRAEQGQIARGGGVTHRAAVLVLSAIAAIVLSIFDAPVLARQFEQLGCGGLLGPIGGHGKSDVVGFFDHLALSHLLHMAAEAHDLSHSG